jgi:hypothetical protein
MWWKANKRCRVYLQGSADVTPHLWPRPMLRDSGGSEEFSFGPRCDWMALSLSSSKCTPHADRGMLPPRLITDRLISSFNPQRVSILDFEAVGESSL